MRSMRKRSGRKSGSQNGHPGVTRVRVDDPDWVVVHAPTVGAGCGAGSQAAEFHRERLQVIQLPEPRLEVTEHQALHKACAVCQTVTAGAFPPGVIQPVQHLPRTQVPVYEPRTKAVAV